MKTFYQLIANTVVSSITNFTVWFGITFYAYLQTQSVLATSIISGLFLVSTAFTGFWFGSLVDNYKKKHVMLASSLFSLVAYAVGFLIYITTAPGTFADITSIRLWVFIPILLAGVIAGNIRTIALPTLVTLLVPEKNHDKANGMVGTASGVGFLVTSMISGFLVGHSGMFALLILAGISTILAMLHLWTIRIPEKEILHTESGSKNIDLRATWATVVAVPGLIALILFSTFNNFLGGVFMALMDAYGLSLVSVQTWGVLWGFLSLAFIVGGLIISKWGLGKSPLRAMFMANTVIWIISSLFTVYPSIILLIVGMFIYLSVVPYIEAAEHTIIQKVVPAHRQGRVFGFAQSVEQAASPLTAFAIGPIAEFLFIPFMTTGAGVDLIGQWYGVGSDRGIALVFTITGVIGLTITLLAWRSRQYALLSQRVSTSKTDSSES